MILRELTIASIVIRIFAAIFMGGLIGMERGMNNHSAGLRTYMLVCLGSALIMMTNQYVCQITGSGDMVRMGAQVVNGIGFLGAGTIMVTRNNQIKGLTTAAGLWAAAGVGLAIGIGFYEAAFVAGITIFIILTILRRWDNRMMKKSKIFSVYVELSKEMQMGKFLRTLRRMEIYFDDVQIYGTDEMDLDGRCFLVTLHTKQRQNHNELLEKLRAIEGVKYLDKI